MKRIPVRIIITTRDICNILGVSRQTASRRLARIRKTINKSSKDMVTVREFCEVMKFDEQTVRENLA